MKPATASIPAVNATTHYRAGEIPGGGEHEELLVGKGPRSGVPMAIAVHSTTLGPALGGLRMWHYEREDDGVADALRLAAAMTRKAAVAGLRLGGGKAVIALPGQAPPTAERRRRILLDLGDLVETLEGRYLTAEDVGTSPVDMLVVAERTAHVTGRAVAGGSGDPSPFTAIGVEAAMRAACRRRLGDPSPSGRRIAIVGTGHVGEHLARSLAAKGAELMLCDLDPGRRALAEELGASWLEPAEALATPCDVLAPCAVGGAISAETIDELRCKVICGAANNQLAESRLADVLARRNILYAPDYIANAGGLISIYGELNGYGHERAARLALAIEQTVDRALELAELGATTPLQAAEALARQQLAVA